MDNWCYADTWSLEMFTEMLKHLHQITWEAVHVLFQILVGGHVVLNTVLLLFPLFVR